MSYLKFDKSRMVNLEYSLSREILRTNRRGAYHCTTLVECNTRKQHGLLVMPVPELDDQNHVLLSSFDEAVIQHGAEFNLGIHKYDGDNYSPQGHKYIREFDCDSCPKTIYRVGGVILSKEKMFSLEDNTFLIRYTLLDAHSPTTLKFRPFLAFRNVNALTSENPSVSKEYKEVENGISACLYDGYPDLYMQFNKAVSFTPEPFWYKGIEYKTDMEQGYPYKEDLFVPGYFELSIAKGESIVFAASDKKSDTDNLLDLFEKGIGLRTPRSSFFNCMKNSAHQFYYQPAENQLYLLEGYPWFEAVSARDQFMGLGAMTLCLNKEYAFDKIMDSAMPAIRQLLHGKKITGLIKGLDEADVLLWVVYSIKEYSEVKPEHCIEKYGNLVNEIIRFITKNKHPELHFLDNGLVEVQAGAKPTNWMKGVVDGSLVVYRSGCLVDLNALWYNAVMYAADMEFARGSKKKHEELSLLGEKIKDSFLQTFKNNAGYLYDYVDGEQVGWSVRPNMLWAIAIDYPLLEKREAKSILDLVTRELLTPKGLRSLSPKSEGYSPYGVGTPSDRTYAMYNGMAHLRWVTVFFDAYLKIHKRGSVSFIERILAGVEDEMANDCIGSLSEVYDGAPPYAAMGAFSHMLSVAAVVKILTQLDKLED